MRTLIGVKKTSFDVSDTIIPVAILWEMALHDGSYFWCRVSSKDLRSRSLPGRQKLFFDKQFVGEGLRYVF